MSAQPVRSYQMTVAALSLVAGPLLMSVGDLMHPREKMDAGAQATVITEHASRWYTAHLLLFLGMLLLIPGLLALTRLAMEHRPGVGYTARLFLMIGAGALSAVFASEMLVGQYAADGADANATAELLETFQSSYVLGAMLLGVAAFFLGVATFAVPFVIGGGPYRVPAFVLIVGSILVLTEIVSSQVIFSQIGNVAILAATTAFAWQIVRDARAAVGTVNV